MRTLTLLLVVLLPLLAQAQTRDADPPTESTGERDAPDPPTESTGERGSEASPNTAPNHALAGLPVGPEVEQVVQERWTVGYSRERGGPLYACYPLGPAPQPIRTFKRKRRFRSFADVTHTSYTRSGYTRGHMVPRWAMSSRYDKAASDSTFSMANVVPQLATHNAGVWDDLEHQISGRWDGRDEYTPGWADVCPGGVWVTVGPIYGDEPATLETDPRVEIPEAFYCVVVSREDDQVEALAFLIPHEGAKRGDLTPYLVSVDEVEARTGLDLLWALDDAQEDALEAKAATALWPTRKAN
jgi:endonuclease G